MSLRLVRACAAALLSAALASSASAQSAAFPNQMVRIVVVLRRQHEATSSLAEIADKLNRKWNQAVIVENRPGIAGTAATAKAPADGHAAARL